MPGKMDVSRGRLASRLIGFYVILAAITVAVVIVVIDKGRNEKPQPAIAGGYLSSAPAPCIGPVPKPVGGQPLPPTAPTQLPATGPSFNVLQSGQFVNFTNNQSTLGGKLRLNDKTLPGGGHRLTGNVECVSGGKSLALDAVAVPRRQGLDHRFPRRPSIRRNAQERSARSGRSRAEDPDQRPGHVRVVAGLDLLRQQVHTRRHRIRRRAVRGQ